MKKILLLIFLFLFCINVNVNAEETSFSGHEYLDGISYMKWDGENYYYRNAQVIRNDETGEIAYCVEPFTLLSNGNIHSSSEDFDSMYGITEEDWNLVKLFAYYGYGYKDHQDPKWISITQIAIWRTLFPNLQFDWVDNIYDGNVITPFNDEVWELFLDVDNHYILPSFESSYDLSINDKLEIIDSNDVLKFFTVNSSDFDYEIDGNKLIINAGNVPKEGVISFIKQNDNYSDGVMYFYSSASQNVIRRGNVEPVEFSIKVKVNEGKIIVNKLDSDTLEVPKGEAVLDGAVFNLFDKDMNLIDEATVEDRKITFNNLSYGKYYIKEKSPGKGYYLNDKVYEVVIDKDNLEQVIDIENDAIKTKIKITKYFGTKEEYESNNMSKEEGASFEIYDLNNKLIFSGITNEDGVIELVLPFGNYILKQISSIMGYQMNDDYSIVVDEHSNYSMDIVLYDFKINVPNAFISYGNFTRGLWDLCLAK